MDGLYVLGKLRLCGGDEMRLAGCCWLLVEGRLGG